MIQGINSAYLHATQVNPDVEFRVIWANTWFDPAIEADAAQALIDEGADVIFQHTDSTAPHAVAQEAGAFAFGQANDMSQFAPAPRISAIVGQLGTLFTSSARRPRWTAPGNRRRRGRASPRTGS